MTGEQYIAQLTAPRQVVLAHDLRSGSGKLLARAGVPFLVQATPDAFGSYALAAYKLHSNRTIGSPLYITPADLREREAVAS